MGNEQHCLACRTEYVAGVTACADCGGPLEPGPLPEDLPAPADSAPGSPAREALTAEPPDTLYATLPGAQAEFAAKALTMEGIGCLLECRGIRRLRLPGEEPTEPLATTLPVNIYLPGRRIAEAEQILGSLAGDDPVGGQWSDGKAAPDSESEPAIENPMESAPAPLRPALQPAPLRQEGTGLRLLFLVGLAALLSLLMFGSAP